MIQVNKYFFTYAIRGKLPGKTGEISRKLLGKEFRFVVSCFRMKLLVPLFEKVSFRHPNGIGRHFATGLGASLCTVKVLCLENGIRKSRAPR